MEILSLLLKHYPPKESQPVCQESNISGLFVLKWGPRTTSSLLLSLAGYTRISSILDMSHKTSLCIRKLVPFSDLFFCSEGHMVIKWKETARHPSGTVKIRRSLLCCIYKNQLLYSKALYKF